MPTVHGTYRNGTFVPDAPVDWPDGERVVIQTDDEPVGMREEDWPTTPEGIAAWIKRTEAFEPVLTPEEQAAWKQAKAEQKAWELAHWEERSRKIERMFE